MKNELSESINQKALSYLAKQNWEKAQSLFFYNAKINPSHETYNNLGYFLITEGLTCKNGKTRNALKLGAKYLLKASELKNEVINLCALVTALDYELRDAGGERKTILYKKSREYLEKALEIHSSNELQYNLLRIKYLLHENGALLLENAKSLVSRFTNENTVSLYFGFLCRNSRLDEAMICIDKYIQYIDPVDLLMLYAKFGEFEKCCALSETLIREYAPDKFISAAIIESFLKTQRYEQAQNYAQQITDDDIGHLRKEKWCKPVFENSEASEKYRREIIDSYQIIPPQIDFCCYYGCEIHKNEW